MTRLNIYQQVIFCAPRMRPVFFFIVILGISGCTGDRTETVANSNNSSVVDDGGNSCTDADCTREGAGTTDSVIKSSGGGLTKMQAVSQVADETGASTTGPTPVEPLRFREGSDWAEPYIAFSGRKQGGKYHMTDDGVFFAIWWEKIGDVRHIVAHRFDPKLGWLAPVTIDGGLRQTYPDAVIDKYGSRYAKMYVDESGNAVVIWEAELPDERRMIWSSTYIKGKGWHKKAVEVLDDAPTLNTLKFSMNKHGQGIAIWSDRLDRATSPHVATSTWSLWSRRFHIQGGWSDTEHLATRLAPTRSPYLQVAVDADGNALVCYPEATSEGASLQWRRLRWTGNASTKGRWSDAAGFSYNAIDPDSYDGFGVPLQITFNDAGAALVMWRGLDKNYLLHLNTDDTVTLLRFPISEDYLRRNYRLALSYTSRGFLLNGQQEYASDASRGFFVISSQDDGATWGDPIAIDPPDGADDLFGFSFVTTLSGEVATLWSYSVPSEADPVKRRDRHTYYSAIDWDTSGNAGAWTTPQVIFSGFYGRPKLVASPGGNLSALSGISLPGSGSALLMFRHRSSLAL